MDQYESAVEGCINGGSAAVITSGEIKNSTELHVIQTSGRKLTSSFEEERNALPAAVNGAEANFENKRVLVCTDSQLLMEGLDNFAVCTSRIQQSLDKNGITILIQWIPGHSEIPGNEMADKFANDGP